MPPPALKTLIYRGGLIRFRIPAHWQEEYEPAGGGTFYAPGNDTGTLRLNVMTMKAPSGKSVTERDAIEVLRDEAHKHGAAPLPLRKDLAISCFDVSAEERGNALIVRYWRLAQLLPPDHLRLALFSYTSVAQRLADPSVQSDLHLIDQEIRAAELSPTLGQMPRSKRWWKLW